MPEAVQQDFLQLISNPLRAYDEGLRFFRGQGLMNQTIKQFARDMETRGIPYAVIGAIALNQYGYQRFTHDLDVLMTSEGLARFRAELLGRGYRLAFADARKTFRSTAENVPIEVITSGEFPGDGRPKPVVFPDPETCSISIDGVRYVTLAKLVELKLASGISAGDRLKDLGDVQELIRTLALGPEFAEQLDPYVQPIYLDLQGAIRPARQE